jgi:hypothetical protein
MSYQSLLQAVILRRGSIWKPDPYNEPPYLMAAPGNPWPDGAPVTITFTDTSGATLLEVDAEATPTVIQPLADPQDVDLVPAGANFEVVIETDDGPEQIRYGKVLRREAEFLTSPALSTRFQPLAFTDTFPTLGLRSSWQPVSGRTKIYDNSADSLPNGVGPDLELFFSASSIRWFQPLAGDAVRVNFNLLNQGWGKARIILCANQQLTSGLGVEFEEGLTNHKVHMCTFAGPDTVTYQGSSIDHTVTDNENHVVLYNPATNTVAVYASDGTIMTWWTDAAHVVPHGPGYTYTGLSFHNAGLSPGLQVSYWAAKDDN